MDVGVVIAIIGAAGLVAQALIGSRSGRIASLEARVGTLERRLERSLSRQRQLEDYALELREHIINHLPPPPPEWPDLKEINDD